ncbi:MAG: cell division protein FtsZ, partial [Halomonas sp.]|nr:cell division protein FtsZ [Halomonas sp.]MDX5504467.1 cell division protein FtsZ [Halomonas sp.]
VKRNEGSEYRQRPQPAMRQQSAVPKAEPQEAVKPQPEKRRSPQELDDYLDIPAFLRRQAD